MSELIAQGYGQILAQAREAKGLTVAQVADKLKLTSRQIEALEAEDASRLPATVFVRGFIRNYARLVEVPLESLPVVAEAPMNPTETITAHSEELRFHTSPVRRWLLLPMAVFGLFLILVALLYTWLSQGEEAYVPAVPAVTALPVPPAVPPAVPAPAILAPAPETAAPAANPAEPVAAATVPPSSAAPVVPPPAGPSPSQPASPASSQPLNAPAVPAPAKPAPPLPAPVRQSAPVPAPAPAPAPAYSSPFSVFSPPPAPVSAPARPAHTVQLVAEQSDSWIQVVSGDDKHYSRLLRVGEQLTLRGAPPFRLVVGSAAGVRLSYDGKAIDLRPYTGDKVARLTLE